MLVPHVSAVADFDLIQEDAAVDQQYIDEMTELLARRRPARRTAFMLGGGKKRYGESATRQARAAHERQAGPVSPRRQHRRFGGGARRAHRCVRRDVDLERVLALGALQPVARRPRRRRRTSRSRCATPARSHRPTRSRSRPITDGAQRHRSVHDTTSYLYNPAHRWYYFRDMTPRRGARVQVARHRSRCARPRAPTPRSPTRPARRVSRPRAERRDARRSRCSTDARRTIERDTTWRLTVDDVVERAARSPTSRIPNRRTSAANLEAIVAQHERGGGLTTEGVEGALAHADVPRCATASRSTATSPTPPASTTLRLAAADLPHRAAAFGHHLLPVPVRPGPRAADAAHLGGRTAGAAAGDRRRVGAAPASRRASRTPASCARRPAGRSTRSTSPTSTGRRSAWPSSTRRSSTRGSSGRCRSSGYLDYLLHTADLQEAYEYHARVLKLLQWGSPRAAVDAEVAVSPARARRHRRPCTPTRRSS